MNEDSVQNRGNISSTLMESLERLLTYGKEVTKESESEIEKTPTEEIIAINGMANFYNFLEGMCYNRKLSNRFSAFAWQEIGKECTQIALHCAIQRLDYKKSIPIDTLTTYLINQIDITEFSSRFKLTIAEGLAAFLSILLFLTKAPFLANPTPITIEGNSYIIQRKKQSLFIKESI